MITVQTLVRQLGRAADPGAPVRAHDDQGRVWDVLAAVQLQNKTVALQVRQASTGPDTLTRIDQAMTKRLALDLDELNDAYRALKLECDHWRTLLRQAEERLAAIRRLTGT